LVKRISTTNKQGGRGRVVEAAKKGAVLIKKRGSGNHRKKLKVWGKKREP